MNIDVRGFIYPLDALQRKQQWRLDALKLKLAQANAALDAQRNAIAELENKLQNICSVISKKVGEALTERFDLFQHRYGIDYLAQLQHQIQQQKQDLNVLQTQRAAVLEQCLWQQQKLELGKQHRQQCWQDYRQLQGNLQSAEADRDFLARRQWHSAQGSASIL